ncbi:MAG: hypothetical protein IJX55_00495 [Clostridia bacterium]|nr:hypothetical protein [Clostridia bacterium]
MILNISVFVGMPFILCIAALIIGNELFITLAANIFLTVPLLWLAFKFCFSKEQRKSIEAIFIYVYAGLIWIGSFLPWNRVSWILYFIYALVCGIYLLYSLYKILNKDFEEIVNTGVLCVSEVLMVLLSLNTYITTDMSTLFLIAVIILAMIISAVILYLFIWREHMGMPKKIGYSLGVLFLVFLLTFYYAENLNYAFDFSAPQEYRTVVSEKDYSSNRGGTNYYLTVYVNGKMVDLRVQGRVYDEYEVGDFVNVSIYEGAFGMTYYTMD